MNSLNPGLLYMRRISVLVISLALVLSGLMAGPARAAACPTVSSAGSVTPEPTVGINWNGCNLYGAIFTNTNFTSATLSNTILIDAKFINSTLTNVDFSGANLTGVSFANSVLTGASINNALLTNASFLGVTSGRISGTPSQQLTSPWKVVGGYLIGPEVNLVSADLTSANLTGANLTGANLTGANLTRATLTNASLEGALLVRTNLARSTGSSVNFYNAVIAQGNFELTSLPGSNFTNVNSGYATSTYYGVGRVNFHYANLRGSNFSNAFFSHASFEDAEISDCLFVDAKIYWSELDGSEIDGTDFLRTEFGSNRSGNITGVPINLPSDYNVIGGFLLGPFSVLWGANLSGLELGSVNLSGSYLYEANLSGASLSGTNLHHVRSGRISGIPLSLPVDTTIQDGYFLGPGAWLDGLDLSHWPLAGRDLRGASLSRVNIENANLAGTQMAGAIMNGLSSSGVYGNPISLPQDWTIRSGFLIGPNADLSDKDLRGLNLDAVNLSDAEISNADLSNSSFIGTNFSSANLSDSLLVGANLTNANLSETDLHNTNLSDANLFNIRSRGAFVSTQTLLPQGYESTGHQDGRSLILGRGVNLSNENLSDMVIWDVSLQGANLAGANLSEASLANVDLRYADVTGANFSSMGINSVSFDGLNLATVNMNGVRSFNRGFRDSNRSQRDESTWLGAICPSGLSSSRHVDGSCLKGLTKNPVKAVAKVKPKISGTAKVKKTLTAKKGTWTGYPAPKYSYQWYACSKQVKSVTATIPKTCKRISKATKSKFAVTKSLKGKHLAVLVTGKGSGTTATKWLSKTTAKVK